MFDTPTTLSPAVLKLAEMSYEIPLDLTKPWPNDFPPAIRILAENLISDFAQEIADDDIQAFQAYNDLFTISGLSYLSFSEKIARIKLGEFLHSAWRRLTYQRLDSRSPVFDVLPSVAKHLDDEGLVPLGIFSPLHDALEIDGMVVYLHSSIPYDLEMYLIRMLAEHLDASYEVKCALSAEKPHPTIEHLVRLREEREYGKPFSRDEFFEPLKESPSVTVFRRIPKNEEEARFLGLFHAPVERLEVQRTERKQCLSFMLEELIPIPENALKVGYISTRMFHSEFVRSQGTFRHVDGSLLIYDIETYNKRLASRITEKVKAQAHIKLFRFDGSIPFEVWSLTLQKFLPKNELVEEFLQGK